MLHIKALNLVHSEKKIIKDLHIYVYEKQVTPGVGHFFTPRVLFVQS